MKPLKHVFKIMLLLFLLSCGNISERARQERMNGVNGEAIYIFKKDNSIWGMYKEDYNNKDFQIFLHSDTVLLGGDFHSSINVGRRKSKTIITSPNKDTISNDGTHGFKPYRFRPLREGIYDFDGTIQYDSTVVDFHYKFIVIRRAG